MIIAELNSNVKKRNQFVFGKENVILPEVKTAFGYKDVQAKRFISSICKLITFWFELNSKELSTLDVVGFLRKCVAEGWVRKEDAYINEALGYYDGVFLKTLATKFGVDAIGVNGFQEFLDWAETQGDFVGTIRIISKSGGRHSLICYKQNGKLYISDTSSRGIGVDFFKHINKDNFVYYTMITGKIANA